MISHRKINNKFTKEADKLDKERKSINWEMSKFRHALFHVADVCKTIVDCSVEFDIPKRLSICYIFFKTRSIRMSYNCNTGMVNCIVLKNGCVTETRDCKVEKLSIAINELKPKSKFMIVKTV